VTVPTPLSSIASVSNQIGDLPPGPLGKDFMPRTTKLTRGRAHEINTRQQYSQIADCSYDICYSPACVWTNVGPLRRGKEGVEGRKERKVAKARNGRESDTLVARRAPDCL
jgi:hypothetical protein